MLQVSLPVESAVKVGWRVGPGVASRHSFGHKVRLLPAGLPVDVPELLVLPEEVWEAQTATGEVAGKTAPEIIGRLPSLGLAVARASSTNVLVAQWIAHQTSNLGVAGSNPVGCCRLYSSAGRASAS